MHTYRYPGSRFVIHHNSDLSGNIHIVEVGSNKQLMIPSEDILGFIASFVRDQRISELEQATDHEILQIDKSP